MKKWIIIFFGSVVLLSACCTKKAQNLPLTDAIKNSYGYKEGQALLFSSNLNDSVKILLKEKIYQNQTINNHTHFSPCKLEIGYAETAEYLFLSSEKELDSLSFHFSSRLDSNRLIYNMYVSKQNTFKSYSEIDQYANIIPSSTNSTSLTYIYNQKTYSPIFKFPTDLNYQANSKIAFLYFANGLGLIGFDMVDGTEYRLVRL